jgi:hypothetical protein
VRTMSLLIHMFAAAAASAILFGGIALQVLS